VCFFSCSMHAAVLTSLLSGSLPSSHVYCNACRP
jgi:hypothetical protein